MEHEIEEINVGGYNGNTGSWSPTNGSGATVHTSNDKILWTQVGVITSLGAFISNVKLKKTNGKYLKFNHTSYLGLGYLEIIQKKSLKNSYLIVSFCI